MIQILHSRSGKKILEIETLQGADLRNANLNGADLQYADLQYANLRNADLNGANLQGADLLGADLRSADLNGANLQGADLRNANLEGTYLRGADLQLADLRGADLRGANLRGANLRGAHLDGAVLSGCNLSSARLYNTKLYNALIDDVIWPLDLTPLSAEDQERNLRIVAALALSSSESLDMGAVHRCNTTHCMAGWAIHALPYGYKLEEKYSWWIAGLHLLGAEAARMFYASEDTARSFLEQYLVDPVDA